MGFSDHSMVIDKDMNLWAWGQNNRGQLGDGTTTQRTSPVQINLSNVVSLMDQEPIVEKLEKYLISTIDGLFHFKDSVWSLVE